MPGGIAGIDHIIVGVRSLEQARMAWTRLGFTLSPRGRHIGQGTANYCIMFPSDYVELLGIVDAQDFVQRLDVFLARREGVMATAFAPSDSPEEVRSTLLEGYDRLFGIQKVTTTDAVVCVQVGRHRILFSTPDDFSTMHPALDLDPHFRLPGIISLEFGIERCEHIADYLTQWQVAFDELPDGSLVVPASEANGAILL